MSQNIPAVYHAGVFQPLEPVDLPEGTRAEVTPLPHAESVLAETTRPADEQPKDDWERRLLALAKDCGTSLSDAAVSSEGLYD